jgi:hypothetical protein
VGTHGRRDLSGFLLLGSLEVLLVGAVMFHFFDRIRSGHDIRTDGGISFKRLGESESGLSETNGLLTSFVPTIQVSTGVFSRIV